MPIQGRVTPTARIISAIGTPATTRVTTCRSTNARCVRTALLMARANGANRRPKVPDPAATKKPVPTFRLWVISGVNAVRLRCSCGWVESFDNGVEFGPVGHAATAHNREAHGG